MDKKVSALCKRKRHNGNQLGSDIIQPTKGELFSSGELNTVIITVFRSI